LTESSGGVVLATEATPCASGPLAGWVWATREQVSTKLLGTYAPTLLVSRGKREWGWRFVPAETFLASQPTSNRLTYFNQSPLPPAGRPPLTRRQPDVVPWRRHDTGERSTRFRYRPVTNPINPIRCAVCFCGDHRVGQHSGESRFGQATYQRRHRDPDVLANDWEWHRCDHCEAQLSPYQPHPQHFINRNGRGGSSARAHAGT